MPEEFLGFFCGRVSFVVLVDNALKILEYSFTMLFVMWRWYLNADVVFLFIDIVLYKLSKHSQFGILYLRQTSFHSLH